MHVLLESNDSLLHRTRVSNGITLEQSRESRDGLVVIRTLSELHDGLLQTVHHNLTFITTELLLGTLLSVLSDLSDSIGYNLGDVCNFVSKILA
jgi:hypothetical protein